MLRAIGRALRSLVSEALEGSTNWVASWGHMFGRFIYSWFRSDREISDAVALVVAGSALVMGLIVLGLLTAFIIGVFSWLSDPSPQTPGPGRTPDPEPPDSDERPWWD